MSLSRLDYECDIIRPKKPSIAILYAVLSVGLTRSGCICDPSRSVLLFEPADLNPAQLSKGERSSKETCRQPFEYLSKYP
ncbi:hypothetical protein SCHPADRAFT_908190 [Schizopora paradoxa]|uniref:Uncharacterized protein n=1 Tax=Schizopora paradoxa TaxID=27342 RepID=A0A0H2RHL7_9AGAM|nr:hypothetical protein SCHPADRAFT_908190 [Schizopora paradoxa]